MKKDRTIYEKGKPPMKMDCSIYKKGPQLKKKGYPGDIYRGISGTYSGYIPPSPIPEQRGCSYNHQREGDAPRTD